MTRRIPSDRFQEMIDAATAVFIEQGYRRTQMADVAAAHGRREGHALPLRREQGGALRPRRALRRRAAPVRHTRRASPAHSPAGSDARRSGAPPSRPGRAAFARRRALSLAGRRCARGARGDPARALRRARAQPRRHQASRPLRRDYPELAALWFSAGREAGSRASHAVTSKIAPRRGRFAASPIRRSPRASCWRRSSSGPSIGTGIRIRRPWTRRSRRRPSCASSCARSRRSEDRGRPRTTDASTSTGCGSLRPTCCSSSTSGWSSTRRRSSTSATPSSPSPS